MAEQFHHIDILHNIIERAKRQESLAILSSSSPLAANFRLSRYKINDNRYQESLRIKRSSPFTLKCEFRQMFSSFLWTVSGPLRCTTCLSYGKKIITVGAVSSKSDFSRFVFFRTFAHTPRPCPRLYDFRTISGSKQSGRKDYRNCRLYMHTGEIKRFQCSPNFAGRKSERKCLTPEAIVKSTKLRRYRVWIVSPARTVPHLYKRQTCHRNCFSCATFLRDVLHGTLVIRAPYGQVFHFSSTRFAKSTKRWKRSYSASLAPFTG